MNNDYKNMKPEYTVMNDTIGFTFDKPKAPFRFMSTRKYLFAVRELKQRAELLERRIEFRKSADLNSIEIEIELEDVKQELTIVTSEVAETISRLENVDLEMVLVKRYIDGMTWEDIAADMDMQVRTILCFHGKALPKMHDILMEDGIITSEEMV